MFSYRHAFHAGSHADVLKHMALLVCLEQLQGKEAPLMIVDTHAGAGMYALDRGHAMRSGEAQSGIARLWSADKLAEPVAKYVEAVRAFNARHGSTDLKFYPGSPLLIFDALRPQDKLRLFELHPSDHDILAKNAEQLSAGRQLMVQRADGFEGLKAFLPPPQRRGLVLMDPSFEDKRDYKRVWDTLSDALMRFATGTYMVWYPAIERPEARNLPERLKKLAPLKGPKPDWLHVVLRIGQAPAGMQMNLQASGLFIINPPFQLEAVLRTAVPALARLLGGAAGSYLIESSARPAAARPNPAGVGRPSGGRGLAPVKAPSRRVPVRRAEAENDLAPDPRGIVRAAPAVKAAVTAAAKRPAPRKPKS